MDFRKTKIEKLREICLNHHLPTDGKKEVLIDRIKDYEAKQRAPIQKVIFDEPRPQFPENKKGEHETNALFIKMKSSNLSRYYNAGIIYPLALENNLIYKEENRKIDFFNLHPEYIIFVNCPVNAFNEDDIYVHVITDELNIEKSQEHSCLFFVADPIPISRVHRIYFKSPSSRSSFLSSVATFPDFAIPEQICKVGDFDTNSVTLDLVTPALQPNDSLKDWPLKLDAFDKLMGLFSFTRNNGIFFAERTNQYQEFTPTFFHLLALMNSKLDLPIKEPVFLKPLLFPLDLELSNKQRILFRMVLEKIYTPEEFSLAIGEEILEETLRSKGTTTEEEDGLKRALDHIKKLKAHQTTFFEVLRIDSIKKNLPLLALLVLIRYPNKSRQHTDKQAARLLFINDNGFTKQASEFLLAILGMYYGYKTLIKRDTNLKLNDNIFASLAEKQQRIKFTCDTRLEKVIVETIYYWCKNGKEASNNFAYLIAADVNSASLQRNNNTRSDFLYDDKSVILVDTRVTIVERISQSKSILEKIEAAYPREISPKSILLQYVIQRVGLSKELFREVIQRNIHKLDVSILDKLTDFDQDK